MFLIKIHNLSFWYRILTNLNFLEMKYFGAIVFCFLFLSNGFNQSKKKQIESLKRELIHLKEKNNELKLINDSLNLKIKQLTFVKKNYQIKYVQYLQQFNQVNSEAKVYKRTIQNYALEIDSLIQITEKYGPKKKSTPRKEQETAPNSFAFALKNGGNGGTGSGEIAGYGSGHSSKPTTNVYGRLIGQRKRKLRKNISKTSCS